MIPTTAEAGFRPTEVLILAGGLGSRLRQAVPDVPKPMAPVNGRPFLDYLMAHWKTQGISRFVLSVGYMADAIQAHFCSDYHGCAIDYARESSPLGTGGAIRNAVVNGRWSGTRLLIINGDTWFPIQLEKLVANAVAAATPVTLAVKRITDNDRYGGLELDQNGKVKRFIPGAASRGNPLINGGIYLADIAYLEDCLQSRPDAFSFERDVLEPLAMSGLLGASLQDVPFLDIGVPADYLRAKDIVAPDTTVLPNRH